MASSYTGLGTELMTTGENAGTWGTTTNTNLQIIEQISGGYTAQSIAGGVQTTTLSVSDGSTGAVLAHRVIEFTGTITGNQTVTIPLDVQQLYVIKNGTSGAYTVNFKYATGSGSSITFAATDKGTKLLYAAADHATNPNIVDTGLGSTGAYDLDGNELTLDPDADTSITASTDDQIDFEISGADDFTMTANAFNVLTGSHVTFADSANAKFGTGNDMLVYHDGSNSYITNAQGALKIATETSGIAVTIGHTTSETTIADNLTVTGTLTGTLATAAQGSVTSLGTLTTLTVDNVITNGTTIGHTSDTDLMTLADGVLTVAGELDATTLDISGNADIDGTTNLDAVDIDGAVQLDAALTVGVDDTGYDVKFFGDTASAYMLWDTSADDLVLAGAAGIDLAGDIDVDGTANLDAVDIDGAVQIDGAVTVGVDGTGLDVKFFGDTSGSFLLWDQSDDALELTDSSPIKIGDAADMQIYHDGSNSYITNGTGALKLATETSGIAITIGHTTSEVTIADNLTVTGTLTLGSNAELTEAELEFLDGITAGTAAASKAMVADANIDITGGRNITISGELDAATLDISGNADIDGTTNLDAVDIDDAVQIDGTVTVGVDDTGLDVKFFGATSGSFLLWDESDDALELTDSSPIKIGDAADMQIYHDGTNSYITNGTGALKLATETSGIAITIGHTTSEVTVADNLTVTGTLSGTLATAAQASVTSLGTLTALTVDDVAINGKVMTMTGSTSDTAVLTVGTNGTLSIVTTDDAAAAANMTLTADGTFEADGTTVTLDSDGDVVLDAGGADVFLKDDGTLFGTLTNSGGELVIKSSSSGTTALTFSGANATFAGTLATAAGGFNIAGLDIDGATDIGEAIVDADLFIIDNGAGGTNRKVAASRIVTYIDANSSAATVGKAIAMAIVFG